MKLFLKVAICFVILFSFSEAKAQMSVGGGLVYGTEINNIGLSLNGKYVINEKWSAAPSYTYFLKKDMLNWSSLDLDANYQIKEIENIGGLYGIAGVNMTFFKLEADLGILGTIKTSGSDTGANLGLGINFPVGKSLTLAPEARYTFGGANYLRIGVTALFNIGK